jgi:P27 family predicted phage terminase small subunit
VLKLLSGTLRKSRANPAEPQPEGDLYAPPEAMTDEQKAEWRYALENAPAGLLRRLDRNAFSQWVIASVDLTVAELAIRTEGTVVNRGGDQRITINADGTQTKVVRSASKVLNPWVKARRDAFDRFMKATSELGFSPTSRSRITLAGGGKKETNRFANNAANKRA